MANSKIKLYKRYIKYQVYQNDVFTDKVEALMSRKLKDDNNKVIKKKVIKHIQNDNNVRLDSIKRAKDKIVDIALLNDFEYFVTFTFNDEIVNAKDYDLTIKKLKKWLDNMVQRNNLLYLLVPELHKSGRIHFHALMSGNLKLVESGHFDKQNRIVYNVSSWKYGFTTAVKIDGCYEAVCKYITKYITKDISKITGNFYYSGGIGLIRKPMVAYSDIDYDTFEGKEYTVPNIFTNVKYLMKRIGDT